ncbi:MAG: hypothetical protein ABIH36_00825 [bacterium]
MPKKTPHNLQPATKADINKAVDELAIAIQKGFSHVDEQFTDIRSDISEMKDDINVMKDDIIGLKKSQSAILGVVKSIDQQLKPHRDLPARVARLERAVFR